MSRLSFLKFWLLVGGSIVVLTGLLLVKQVGASSHSFTLLQESGETLVAPFANGPNGVTSQQSYTGELTLTVSGIGQAAGTQYSDAFYIFTDSNGNPVTPWHPISELNWVLLINGQHAENFIPGQQVPAYREDHIYTFQINAPGGNLTFGVGDTYTVDNTGSYTIIIETAPFCMVPYFSQVDPDWYDHPLRTDGVCSAYCSTIGHCGCTLTSAAMVFDTYGANLNPPQLSDCMGTSACPFYWRVGATCSGGKARWVSKIGFSWARLGEELNQNHRPVILGMHKRGNLDRTHWVVVFSGDGSGDPANYHIHDPAFRCGADMRLSTRSADYDFDWLAIYEGQTPCSALMPSIPPCIDRGSNPQPAPFGTELNMDRHDAHLSFVSTSNLTPSSIISGTVWVYRMTELTMTVEITAQSSIDTVTEMLIWSDSISNTTWQTFTSFVWLPVSDFVYARFRDDLDNVTGVYSDTIHPIGPPTAPERIFLPLILRN